MISQREFQARRDAVMDAFGDENAVLIFGGNGMYAPSGDADRGFWQNASVAYVTGVHEPGITLVLAPRMRRTVMFAPEQTPTELEWSDPRISHERFWDDYEMDGVHPPEELGAKLAMYRGATFYAIGTVDPALTAGMVQGDSARLHRVLQGLREVKSPGEVKEIEAAVNITGKGMDDIMQSLAPGMTEREVAGILALAYRSAGAEDAFEAITTQDGCILHKLTRGGTLEAKRLLIVDTGARVNGYCADITRTFPVSGRFDKEQAIVYRAVYEAQRNTINRLAPGKSYQDEAIQAHRVAAEALVELGVLRGDPDDLVQMGATRLFFYHGLGHHLGIDTHDLTDIDRMATRPDRLREGMVVTVEPGLYFNPFKLRDGNPDVRAVGRSLNKRKARQLARRGIGIRLEDDVLITKKGARILGEPIPSDTMELEGLIGRG